jgi:hypothetical protein
MVCANVRNRPNLRLKCNKFVDFPFGNIGHYNGDNTAVNPTKHHLFSTAYYEN